MTADEIAAAANATGGTPVLLMGGGTPVVQYVRSAFAKVYLAVALA